MAPGSDLVSIIKAYQQVYKQENCHLSQEDLDKGWNSFWKSISRQVGEEFGSGTTSLPLKRSSSSSIVQVGTDSSPKRVAVGISGHNCSTTASSSVLSAPSLQRQASAPAAGHASHQSRPAMAMHPTQASVVGSLNIPHRPSARRASNPTSFSFQQPGQQLQPGLANIDEAQMHPNLGLLARSLDDVPTPSIWVVPSPMVERGEYAAPTSHATQVAALSQVAVAGSSSSSSVNVNANANGMLTPPISDSGLTTASTALSQPMSRSNTDDVLHGVDMMRVDSQSPAELLDLGLAEGGEHDDDFTLFNGHGTLAYDGFSFSPVDSSFPFSSEMKHFQPASQDVVVGNTSSHSAFVQNSHFTVSAPAKGQELRRLEPKRAVIAHDANTAASAATAASRHQKQVTSSPEVKLVEMTLEDGTKVKKAEISRAARQQPPRKTTFCPYCNEQPQGFHGDHELHRHIDRQHRSIRKVWICKDISSNGFLDGCKACRNNKTYGANYNAAAHLRRAHFNPCKNKRGGRGKKSEGRGGIGGGNKPSMEELKNWMYPMNEIIVNGEVIGMQPIPPEGDDALPSVVPSLATATTATATATATATTTSPIAVDLADMGLASEDLYFDPTTVLPMVDQPSSSSSSSSPSSSPSANTPTSAPTSSSSTSAYHMTSSLPSGYQQMMMMAAAMDPSVLLAQQQQRQHPHQSQLHHHQDYLSYMQIPMQLPMQQHVDVDVEVDAEVNWNHLQ